MPGYSCSIRERMLYSSAKGPITDLIQTNLQIPIEKKVIVCSRFIVGNQWYSELVI